MEVTLLSGAAMVGAVLVLVFRARSSLGLGRSASATSRTSKTPNEAARIGGSEVAALQSDLARGHLMSLLTAISGAREGQWSKRGFLSRKLAADIPELAFEIWFAANPHQHLAQLLRGFRRLDAAWKARGHGKASTVSDDGANEMHRMGAEAAEAFKLAAAADPQDPTPWIGRLGTEMLLQPDDVLPRARGHFAEAMRRDPESIIAIEQWLQFLAPHWWGKNGEGLVEARAIAANAPAGSVRPFAIIDAHQSEWHRKRHWGTAEEAAGYFRNPMIIAELRAAHSASIGNGAFRAPYQAVALSNEAAFCFYLAGQKDLVRYELARIGDRYSARWGHLPGVEGPRAGFAIVKKWAA